MAEREPNVQGGGAKAGDGGAAGAHQAGTKGPTRLLILDEDRVEGGMLAFHLRREGLVVMLMGSPDEAIDAIAWAAPDVLLVELSGRSFDGWSFLRSVGELAIDVFGVVDRPLDADGELEALRRGVVEVLTKPLDAQALARKLRDRPARERRGSMPGLPEGHVSGDLVVHSAMATLQMCHRHRLNARLHVEVEGDWAVLLVRHGEVIDAEAPAVAGREAAYQAIRSERGTFVLVPLAPDAEELSRDDVVRADLATLVSDALGRREPRSVNAGRREQETGALPAVGSPRGPMAKRVPGEETLEYHGRIDEKPRSKPESARVKRPGETERRKREALTASEEPPKKPASQSDQPRPRSPTRPMPVATVDALPEVEVRAAPPSAAEVRPTVAPEPMPRAPITAPDAKVVPAAVEPKAGLAGMNPQLRETLDDGGFDEPTDQEARQRARRLGEPGSRGAPQLGGGVGSASAPAPAPRSGLRRTTGSRAPLRDEQGLEPSTTPPVRRIQAPTDRMRSKQLAASRPAKVDGLVIVLAIAAFALAVFVVWRAIANGAEAGGTAAPIAVELPDDPEVRFGAALADLEAGKRDAGIARLEALAESAAPPDGALATLARAYYAGGQLAKAESLLGRLTGTGRADARTWAWLGLVRAARNDGEGARGAFARARAERAAPELDRRLDVLEHAP